jgi:YaiO family outer membrane protein
MKCKLLLILLFLCVTVTFAQSGASSDDLFQQARKVAFDDKNYAGAIALSKQALSKSPDYTDIRVFLGRLYIWSNHPDSARTQLDEVLTKHPDNEDGAIAYASLEYWNNNSAKALPLVTQGLRWHPASTDLLLLKAKILNDLKRFREANLTIDTVLAANPKNTEARALASRIRDNTSKNKISVNYDFIYFDKQFNDPWHLASIDYSRQTAIGSITGRINYANRFNTNGTQFEVDAYPHLSETFYAYVSGGYSGNVGVFPKYRAGFSLYANLPASFEGEAGFRYISFSGPTWIYTASLGKYYKNYWFNFRTFLTPSNNAISQSFALNVRYYYSGADDYFSFGVGTGISPDDPRNNVLLNNGSIYKLRSNSVSAGYRHAFKTFNVFFVNLSLVNQEYQVNTRGNQFDAGVGYIRRF